MNIHHTQCNVKSSTKKANIVILQKTQKAPFRDEEEDGHVSCHLCIVGSIDAIGENPLGYIHVLSSQPNH